MDITLLLKNYILLASGIINLIMSILVLSRGIKHNKVNLYFGLLTFFNFLWVIGLILSRSVTDLGLSLFYGRSTFIFAIGIVISLLYFLIYFPYKIKNISLIQKVVIWVPAVILSIVVYTKFFVINIVTAYSDYEYIAYFNKFFYWLYTIYFVFVALLSLYYLWYKYKRAEGIFKESIRSLFIVVVIGLTFGVFLDLILLYFGNFRFNWLGPVFTVFMNAYVFYLIFNKKEK